MSYKPADGQPFLLAVSSVWVQAVAVARFSATLLTCDYSDSGSRSVVLKALQDLLVGQVVPFSVYRRFPLGQVWFSLYQPDFFSVINWLSSELSLGPLAKEDVTYTSRLRSFEAARRRFSEITSGPTSGFVRSTFEDTFGVAYS